MRKGLAAGHGGINSKFEAGWWETERSNRTECSLQLTPGDWESSCTGNSTPHNPNPWRCSPGQAALGTTAPILQWTTKTRLKAGMEQIGGGRPGSPLAFGCWRMQINELLAITHPEEHETAPIQFPKKVICVFGWNTRHSTLDILVPFCWKWLWLCRILCLLISGYQEIYQTSQADTKMVQHLPSNCHKQISDSDPPKLTLAVKFLINNWANLTESLHSSEIQYINDKNVVIFQKKTRSAWVAFEKLGCLFTGQQNGVQCSFIGWKKHNFWHNAIYTKHKQPKHNSQMQITLLVFIFQQKPFNRLGEMDMRNLMNVVTWKWLPTINHNC